MQETSFRRILSFLDIPSSSMLLRCAIIGLLGILLNVAAQPVIGSAPIAPTVPPALRKPNAATPAPLRPASILNSPFSWGSLSVQPHVTERFIYSDGLQVAPGRTANSYINTLSPGFQVDLGTRWTFDYTPTWTVYTNRSFRETFDHRVNFSGLVVVKSWAAQFTQNYSTATTPLIETARQTERETVGTRFSVRKSFTNTFSVESTIAQDLQFITQAPDFYTWMTENWLQYARSSKLQIGVGVGAGYTDMDPGVNMAYVRPEGRLMWNPSDRLSFTAQAGEEIRQIYSRGVSAIFTPVFSISGGYRPFQHTQVTLSAARSVAPSVLRNQINDTTMWTAGFRQRLLQHFTVSGSYGETESGYNAASDRVIAGRKDNSYHYSIRLGTTFLRRGTINLLYQETENLSNAEGFEFISTQTGVEIGYRY